MNSQQFISLGWRPFLFGLCIAVQGVVLSTASPAFSNCNDRMPCMESLKDEMQNLGSIYVIAQNQQESTLFNNNNIYGVLNSPSNPTQFSLSKTTRLTYFMNYHWNSGRGQAPGTMWLTHQDGTTYGPWQATTEPGQGGVPNAYWIVRPNVILKAGNYTIGDSHPSSWAHNQQSGSRGMSVLKGIATSTPAGNGNTGAIDCSQYQGMERILCEHEVNGDNYRP
ncbi:hypothetical protein [Picosynechococcus sp. PCC 7003]|uniref:hypothetical protein n=1 Tax=Picosynechococcus sp. PCC 7003 TaxID=374981 RepID=UPI000B0D0952|nr:hypothetical protein [Picosynechococcus sp. PCC 7003]